MDNGAAENSSRFAEPSAAVAEIDAALAAGMGAAGIER